MTGEVSSAERSDVLDSEVGTEISENSVLIRCIGDEVPSDSGKVDSAHIADGLSKLVPHASIMLSSLGELVRLVAKSESSSSS